MSREGLARSRVVVWHDLECGGYTADLPLWLELAEREAGLVLDHRSQRPERARVLEIGAGTGRVSLDLARRGHTVTALDRDPELLAALEERGGQAGGVDVVCADAQAFDLAPARFGLVLVPMQTIQLLDDRLACLRAARRHLQAGGLLAAALADALEGFDLSTSMLPPPDLAEHDGWLYASQPVAVRELADRSTIERIRTTLAPDGTRTAEPDAIDLAHVTADSLAAEAATVGFSAEAPRWIGATEEHVGSTVAMLRA